MKYSFWARAMTPDSIKVAQDYLSSHTNVFIFTPNIYSDAVKAEWEGFLEENFPNHKFREAGAMNSLSERAIVNCYIHCLWQIHGMSPIELAVAMHSYREDKPKLEKTREIIQKGQEFLALLKK